MSAIISECGLYRYRLERLLAERGIVVAFFGVNPSTANAEAEDQTTMKWRGFANRMSARKYIAGNPFAYRATDVRELGAIADPVGPENRKHLLQIIQDADLLVPCWGNRSKVPKKLRFVLDELIGLLRSSGKPTHVFGLTKSGDPLHPLMLGYDTQLIRWDHQ